MENKNAEIWFEAFKAEADAFDIYGSGCVAGSYCNEPGNTEEKLAWAEIAFHCKEIQLHIDAIMALKEKFE